MELPEHSHCFIPSTDCLHLPPWSKNMKFISHLNLNERHSLYREHTECICAKHIYLVRIYERFRLVLFGFRGCRRFGVLDTGYLMLTQRMFYIFHLTHYRQAFFGVGLIVFLFVCSRTNLNLYCICQKQYKFP